MSLADLQIRVVDLKRKKLRGISVCKGEIQIGTFKETFVMPLDSWSVKDYEQQWREGLERIKTHDTSCLVTAIQELKTEPYVDLWILYKDGNMIYIQNHIFDASDYSGKNLTDFNIQNCYSYLFPRRPFKYDGLNPQEWEVSL